MAQELYSVRITLKDGRWMKLIRQCRDGKSEHYWPLDIINIPPDLPHVQFRHNAQTSKHKHFSFALESSVLELPKLCFLNELPLFVFYFTIYNAQPHES